MEPLQLRDFYTERKTNAKPRTGSIAEKNVERKRVKLRIIIIIEQCVNVAQIRKKEKKSVLFSSEETLGLCKGCHAGKN